MSQISSINFKKSNAIQATHNDRTLAPSYLISDSGCECNRNAEQAKKLKKQIIENAKEAYATSCKARNKAFQAKSYEWSAVVNIKPDTNMQDLERLAEHFEQKYGFQCYQIAIHRDEGHFDDDNNKVINHHAHLEFVTLDKETGKNCFKLRDFPKSKMREIQDEVAKILCMERGQDKRISNRERVEPRKYAQIKEQERKNTQKLKQDIKTKDNVIQAKNQVIQDKDQELEDEKLSKKRLKEQIEAERKAMIEENQRLKEAFQDLLYIAEDYKKLRALNEKQNITIDELNAEIEQIKKEAREREAQKNQEIQALKADKQRFNELLEQDPALKKAYNQALEALKNRENEEIKYYSQLNFITDDKPLFSINTDKIEHSEQDQTHNEEDELGIDKIMNHKNEDTQEQNKPKIRKYR